MKKYKIFIFLILSSIYLSSGALAQNKPLACQEDESGGLNWNGGRWESAKYNLGRFILVQQGDNLTRDSAAKALGSKLPIHLNCRNVNPEISCVDHSGSNLLFFNPITLKGGMSKIYGATLLGKERDTLSVSAFSCTPF